MLYNEIVGGEWTFIGSWTANSWTNITTSYNLNSFDECLLFDGSVNGACIYGNIKYIRDCGGEMANFWASYSLQSGRAVGVYFYNNRISGIAQNGGTGHLYCR